MHPIKDATHLINSPQLMTFISIHAPYKGCNGLFFQVFAKLSISIHAPYKGCNRTYLVVIKLIDKFQSMHPIKDATNYLPARISSFQISIHAPYKGCNLYSKVFAKSTNISIHAPYKGCNAFGLQKALVHLHFNPCTL